MFEYRKFSELVASVKSDLSIFDDSGLIDEDNLIKVVHNCNERLGQRLHKSKQCTTKVINHKADLPEDLYKIELIFATHTTSHENFPFIGARQLNFNTEDPKTLDRNTLVTINKQACLDECNNCFFVTATPQKSYQTQVTHFKPLILSDTLLDSCAEYSPSRKWKGQYQVDLIEEKLETSFKEGEIYIKYLGKLEDEEGNLLYPFHPIINPYYEWSLKVKILEDMYMNSEADVIQKLGYAKEEKINAYQQAYDYVMSPKVRQWENYKKKKDIEFFNKYIRIFG